MGLHGRVLRGHGHREVQFFELQLVVGTDEVVLLVVARGGDQHQTLVVRRGDAGVFGYVVRHLDKDSYVGEQITQLLVLVYRAEPLLRCLTTFPLHLGKLHRRDDQLVLLALQDRGLVLLERFVLLKIHIPLISRSSGTRSGNSPSLPESSSRRS